MHLELSKVRLHTLKDFGKHYLMIVLSILTALGLEQWVLSIHEHHAADTASGQIEAEIRLNPADVHNARIQDIAQARSLDQLRDSLMEDMQAKVPDAVIAQHILKKASSNGFNLNLRWPTLRHEAWDVMVANQSVQPREFLHVVAQMATMLHESQNNLAMLEQRLGEALPGKTQAHPP